MLDDPSTLAIAFLAAFLTGVTKTGIPGLGVVLPPLMALAVPAKDSVGLLVCLLISGDIAALIYYRHNAEPAILKRLIPFVAVGILLGVATLSYLDNDSLRPFLGWLIVGLLGLELYRRNGDFEHLSAHPALALLVGIIAGFCTAVGNLGGPIMGIYFLLLRLPKRAFLGTTSWFFFIVNSSKVPFYVHLEMIRLETIQAFLTIVLAVALGALSGRKIMQRISQSLFDFLVIGFACISGLLLILSS